MGADNITTCPKCKNNTLFEYEEQGIGALYDIEKFIYYVSYDAVCRSADCGFKYNFEREEPVPV